MAKDLGRLVKGLAAKYCCDGLEMNDLMQEAWVAVLENQDLYTEDMGVSLQTFLGRKIRNQLETFRANNLDLVELERHWIAESVAHGPGASIKAATKAECNALRNALGVELYKKPRRVIETTSATVSLDAETDADQQAECSSLHDKIGTGPEQELGMLAAEMTKKVETKLDRDGELTEIFRLRSEGHTFEHIAKRLGKGLRAVHQRYSRAQKRLAKRAA